MSGTSSVGQSSVYEAGDQRNYKDSEKETAERYHEGKENSHNSHDSSMSLYSITSTRRGRMEGELLIVLCNE